MNENKKINLLYVGNVLSKYGSTPTSIETLAPLLREFYNIEITSDKKGHLSRMWDMISSVMKQRKFLDGIIIDTYSTKNFYYALVISQLARILNINYYTCLRGGDLPNRLERSPYLSGLIFNNATTNVAPSQYLQNDFSKNGYPTTFISNNIKLDNYPFKERSQIQPNILYVRAFSSIYNPQMAIKAFSKLQEEYKEATLCMVGPDKDGTLEACKILTKDLGLDQCVSFPGKLSKEAWITLSSEYDIFINPTNFDNQPVSVMEAMALGFPIISTDVGGVPFLIDADSNGILIQQNNDDMLYEKMSELVKNPDLCQKLSNNAREKAQSFDWNVIQKQWFEILDRDQKNVI